MSSNLHYLQHLHLEGAKSVNSVKIIFKLFTPLTPLVGVHMYKSGCYLHLLHQNGGVKGVNNVKIIFTLFTPFTPGGGWSLHAGICMVFTPFTLFTPNGGVNGVNSVK